jgi:hypothetical protein
MRLPAPRALPREPSRAPLRPMLRPLALALALVLPGLPAAAQSTTPDPYPGWPTWLKPTEDGDHWRLLVSPYTAHFHKDEDGIHENVYLVGLERQYGNGWLWGATYFSNSFGQSSGYVYVGEQVIGWSPWPQLYAKWTAGIVYGYTDPYEDKIPFNVNGFAPGIIVGLGWQFTKQFSMQFNLLGAAGLMFQFTWDLQ